MASNNARQTHVSPGVYTREIDLTYASKSLGITKLGLAGETVKGPAFQPINIENWREFQRYFGGTSTAKFRGSNYPKYELPYIAQSYLKQSNQLQVCRVLGLSGVNAGPAWVITTSAGENGDEEFNNTVIAVLRSRGEHKSALLKQEADPSAGICKDVYEFDGINYYAKNVWLLKSDSLQFEDGCNSNFDTKTNDFTVDATNYGRFNVLVYGGNDQTVVENIETKVSMTNNTADGQGGDLQLTLDYLRQLSETSDDVKLYSISLNPGEQDYILNVLGTQAENGDAWVYVEELYDVALKQMIEDGSIETMS